MAAVAQLYGKLNSEEETGVSISDNLVMFSSLTGKKVSVGETSRAKYWVDNMISPVKFANALGFLGDSLNKKGRRSLKQDQDPTAVDYYLEIGPHSTLKSAIKATISNTTESFTYKSILIRGSSALHTAGELVGDLWCRGYAADIDSFNNPKPNMIKRRANMLVDVPAYPFDHSRKFWLESRLSKGLRFRKLRHLPVLGTPVVDWNTLEPRWRNIIKVSENKWVKDHNVNGANIYPAAGMLVMAMEAAYQLLENTSDIDGYHFKDVSVQKPLVFPAADDGVEVQVFLRPGKERTGSFMNWSKFRICVLEKEEWSDVCHGSIGIEYRSNPTSFANGRGRNQAFLGLESECQQNIETCTSSIEPRVFYSILKDSGLRFGPAFRSLTNLRFNEQGGSFGTTNIHHWLSTCDKDDIISPIMHPTALDAFLQLMCLGLSEGGKKRIPTMVPTSFRSLWISARIAHLGEMKSKSIHDHHASVLIHTKAKLQGFRDAHSTIIGQDSKSGTVVLTADFGVTGIAEANTSAALSRTSRKLCYKIDWKPDLHLMNSDSIYSYCSDNDDFCSPYADVDNEKSQLCHYALRKLVQKMHKFDSGLLNDKPHLRKYLRWAEYQVPKPEAETQQELSQMRLQEMLTQVAANDPQGNLIVAIFNNLERILSGEVEALEVIFNEGLVDEYYDFTHQVGSGFDEALRYIRLLAHKSPKMRILEVGAGTGSATGRVLQCLTEKVEEDSRTYLFQQYVFTDISTSFFEAAKGKFPEYSNVMEYRTLDIERKPIDQGFDIAAFDVVIASNVLHATASLNNTLKNVRQLLKPGGKLVLFELTVPDDIVQGFIFGLLPGWWLSREKHRQWGPTVTRDTWHYHLSSSGLSGVDLAFPALDDNGKCNALISTASHAPKIDLPIPKVAVMVLGNSIFQEEAAYQLQRMLRKSCESCDVLSLDILSSMVDKNYTVCVSLLELNNSILDNISEEDFGSLKYLFSNFETIIWASSEISATANPIIDMTTGLIRCLREEIGTAKIVTIKLQQIVEFPRAMSKVYDVLQTTIGSSIKDCEVEFVEIDSLLCINRVAQYKRLDHFVARKTTPQRSQPQKFRNDKSEPLKLAIEQLGNLSSLQYEVDDSILTTTITADEVEIHVKAAGLNFKDILIALGQDPARYLGIECSGVVKNVGGQAKSNFKVGDRVCCITTGCLHTTVRCDSKTVCRIPDEMSFESAAAFPVAYSSAYYSLVNIARLQPVGIYEACTAERYRPCGACIAESLRGFGMAEA